MGCKECDEIGHEMHSVIHKDGKETQHCIRTTHAEQNAIALAARDGVRLEGATLYCNMMPCYVCAKMIINTGIKRVVARKDYHASARSKEVFDEAGVKYEIVEGGVEEYKDQ
jgi:dCMP deaminase